MISPETWGVLGDACRPLRNGLTGAYGSPVKQFRCRIRGGGGDGLPDQLFPQGIGHKFGLIQLAECIAFRHGNHARIRHAGG